ncbi:MAG: LamG-like jellyroll fold domain-containing protein [Sphingomonas sp.]
MPALMLAAAPAHAAQDGLLFYASADKSFIADHAAGDPVPNARANVSIVPDGRSGGAIKWDDDGYVAWKAPGNIYAARGTLSFFWRPRYPVGVAPFSIFRVGFADHSSWDMVFLRIDWNGHGFDGFVTDANLARVRVSWTIPAPPAADAWHHIAFSWDETKGVRLYYDGKEVAQKDEAADLDSELDQFGLAGRIIAPHQVQSWYNFMRGSDADEIRIYDHMLPAEGIAALAADRAPPPSPGASEAEEQQAWLHRYGWDHGSPPALTAPVTSIRKVEFADAKDLKEWMWKGVDGIAETTWPGVYNRSRLLGRDDYFELPDWNVYVEGGKDYDLTIPAGETVNRVEIRGAAYGTLSYASDSGGNHELATRPKGQVRSVTDFAAVKSGKLRFSNVAQETPIQEIWAYDVSDGKEPAGTFKLQYTVHSNVAPDLVALDKLNAFIAGRFPADERATVVALPERRRFGKPAAEAPVARPTGEAPIVHVLIPSGFNASRADTPLRNSWIGAGGATWVNVHDGLDGIALDLPALHCTPNADGLIPLDIRVKDPIWPGRDMIDVQVSVKPGEPRTLWLDLRDRILTADSLYLSVASGSPDFGAQSLDGMNVRLVFKDRAQALKEHVADRFNQVRDNWGFLVEEHATSLRLALVRRLYGDISDLLRVDPDNIEGRRYWADISSNPHAMPPFEQPEAPAGEPLWAFRQLADLKLAQRFADWWIDNRQVPYGDFGGGISDDTDLVQQWLGLALMGVEPDKLNASLEALDDASYKNGMHLNGLATLTLDELHEYEEGMDADADRLYLNWGDPATVEKLMATTRALADRVILRNPAGHMHFATNWYGGAREYREEPWEWQKPRSYVITHAPILMGIYNADPTARGLITGLMDGWLTHGKKDENGVWTYPDQINWRNDAERPGDGVAADVPLQSAWAAWRFTGDAKYLRPIEGRVAQHGPGLLAELNENAVDVLGRREDWGKTLLGEAATGDDFARYTAWDQTGDLAYLDALHADAIEFKTQHMYMYTEGHWWTDRVAQPSAVLQRERLGGVALWRNQSYPGQTVSWRFADPDAATEVAILLPGATKDAFKVIAYNSSDRPQTATMTTWNVTAGRWRMTGPDGSRDLDLDRSASTEVTFAPHQTTEIDFKLVKAGEPTATRPDLGIGSGDVVVTGDTLAVTVHSLGAKPIDGGTVTLAAKDGSVLASAPVPALAAPADLLPKTARIDLAIPHGASLSGATVHVALSGSAREVTMLNNTVPLRAGR